MTNEVKPNGKHSQKTNKKEVTDKELLDMVDESKLGKGADVSNKGKKEK